MARISLPPAGVKPIQRVADLLDKVEEWHKAHSIPRADAHRQIWYRGHSDETHALEPGVYRSAFSGASASMPGKDVEAKRLRLEQEMLSEFRTSGASLHNPEDAVQTYFLAQHHGLPTRLLDWTTNPLAALFFAVRRRGLIDGNVLVMDARRLIPKPPPSPPPDFPRSVLTVRHPYAVDAIGQLFWRKPSSPRVPLILPVRPDARVARIVNQGSCFTLHAHMSSDTDNPTMERLRVPGKAKPDLLAELRRLGIHEYSLFPDLDHLCQEIKSARGIAADKA